jgi:putative membrane protein
MVFSLQFSYHQLPTVNAVLNLTAAAFLVAGYLFIRRSNIIAHFRAMWSAFTASALFLVSYVTYHTLRQMAEGVGHTRFMLEGFIQYIYYTVLITHLVLAIVIVPLVLITLYRGWTGYKQDDWERLAKHRRIARWTFPIWLYVSLSGVAVYLMLYHLPGASG